MVQPPTAGVACCEAGLSMGAAPTSAHFMGRHTTSIENVQYNPINVKICAQRDCAGTLGNVAVLAERT